MPRNFVYRVALCAAALSALLVPALVAQSADISAAPGGGQTPGFQDRGLTDKRDFEKSDELARKINAPVYEYYAGKIKEMTGVTKGVCIDAGSGSGNLGLALTRVSDVEMIFLDFSSKALEAADKNIVRYGLEKRARTMLADVHQIPMSDNSVDLVVSISSIGSWKDLPGAFREIYRVLKPGGKTYLGVGGGAPEVRAQVAARRKEFGLPEETKGAGPGRAPRPESAAPAPAAPAHAAEGKAADGPAGAGNTATAQSAPGGPAGPGRRGGLSFEESLREAGVTHFAIFHGDDGIWVMITK